MPPAAPDRPSTAASDTMLFSYDTTSGKSANVPKFGGLEEIGALPHHFNCSLALREMATGSRNPVASACCDQIQSHKLSKQSSV